MGLTAIDFLRHGLIDADGKNHLTRSLADLYLFNQPGMLAEGRLFELLGLQVVQ